MHRSNDPFGARDSRGKPALTANLTLGVVWKSKIKKKIKKSLPRKEKNLPNYAVVNSFFI